MDSFLFTDNVEVNTALLCVSNYEDDKNSTLIIWNEGSNQFEEISAIPAQKVTSCQFLELTSIVDTKINSLVYVGVTSTKSNAIELFHYDFSKGELDTEIFQKIDLVNDPLQLLFLQIKQAGYLEIPPTEEISSNFDYIATLVQTNHSNPERKCEIYEWDATNQQFDTIPMQTITLDDQQQSTTNSSNNNNNQSSLLGSIKFIQIQNAFNYLLLLNSQINGTVSQMYSWNGTRFHFDEYIETYPLKNEQNYTNKYNQVDYIYIPEAINISFINYSFEQDFSGLIFSNSLNTKSPIVQIKGECLTECSLHGTCITENFDCICNGDYTGLDCSLRECPKDCSSNGICDVMTGTCSCFSGWEGESCSIKSVLLSSQSISNIENQITMGMPLINIQVPFSNQSEVNNLANPSLNYWFVVKHDLLLWQSWEDITVYSYGLLYFSIDMINANFTREFSSTLLNEQIEELGYTLTQTIDDVGLSAVYKVCHLSQNYNETKEILCCQSDTMEYISTCDVVIHLPENYEIINTAVSLAIYLALIVIMLIILASSKPFLLTSPVLYADDSIPFQIESVSPDLSFLIFFPYKFTFAFIIVCVEFFVISLYIKPSNAPGVYGYYQSLETFHHFTSNTSLLSLAICYTLIGCIGFIGWIALTVWGIYERIRSNRVDQDFIIEMVDGYVDKDFASIPLRPERDSIIHPLIYDISRKICNFKSSSSSSSSSSNSSSKKHKRFADNFTFLVIWLIYISLWLLPCFIVFYCLTTKSTINWIIFIISIIIFTCYLITHWKSCDIRNDRRFVRQWTVSLLPEHSSKKLPYLFLLIFVFCWIGGLFITIITMLTLVRNISDVILAISVNAYSYTIAAFAIGFVILVRSEIMQALMPFQLAKQITLSWSKNFSSLRYHKVLKYLNVHLTRRFIEAAVKSILLTGILLSAFVAITSVSDSYLSDSLLILFTTLIPVLSAIVTYIRQASELEKSAFESAVLKAIPHPEFYDESNKPDEEKGFFDHSDSDNSTSRYRNVN